MGSLLVSLSTLGPVEFRRILGGQVAPSRKGTWWLNVFKTLVCYRLIDPGSEWRLHRQRYEQSALADLLGEDFGMVEN
jgi:hypothetical protein